MRTVFGALAVLLLAQACSTTPPDRRWAQACPIDMPTSPRAAGEGVVIRFLDRTDAMATLGRTEAQVGAPIDRAYLNNRRVAVRMDDGRLATVLVPYEIAVAVGDRVAFQGSYRSPDLPCAYVPNLVTRKLEP